MTTILCTAKYSDNLGDGVIADCQSYLLRRAGLVAVVDLDIGGRRKFAIDVSQRGRLKRIFLALPSSLRSVLVIVSWLVRGVGIRRGWQQKLQHADTLIIGGGQLLQDDYLNFPIKISSLLRMAHQRDMRVLVSCVGVGDNWSWLGALLIRRAFKRVRLERVTTRDQASVNSLRALRLVPASVPVSCVADPASAAGSVYASGPHSGQHKEVGVGIAHPAELRLIAVATEEEWIDFWCEVLTRVIMDGGRVALFTNGSAEDEAFMRKVAKRAPANVRVVERPATPSELVQTISGFRAIVAHRLHANIIAFAVGVPSVALAWDSKVEGFMEMSCQTPWFLPVATPEVVAAALRARIIHGTVQNHLHELVHIEAESVARVIQSRKRR